MSLNYSHPEDLHLMVKSVDRKLTTIIELLTLLKHNEQQQINTSRSKLIDR